MTDTASESPDYIDNSSSQKTRLDLLSAWISGRIMPDSELNEFSESGCSILVPKNKTTPSSQFKLIIMSPDNNEKVHTVITALPRWQDAEFSTTHKKIGMEFLDVSQDLLDDLKQLNPKSTSLLERKIKCSLLIQ